MASSPDRSEQARESYWRETSRLTWIVVILWFISWVGPLILHYPLNNIVIFGFPISFWFAGQGGFGIQTAPAAAMIASALLLGTSPDPLVAGIDAGIYAPGRFAGVGGS